MCAVVKSCFVISSIGGENTDIRREADNKLNYLYDPVMKELDYEVIRSDVDEMPGSISRQIVERIIKSDMVIADISDDNPNVFYELAIRNAVNKPVIIIKRTDRKPPFDIQDSRAISVDMTRPEIWQPAKEQLKKQIQEAEKDPARASKSILSDFTFDLSKEVRTDPSSEILRWLKDLNEKISRGEFRPEPSSIQANKDELIETAIVCKNCEQVIHLKLPIYQHYKVANDYNPIVVECLKCNQKHSYSSKDLIPFL